MKCLQLVLIVIVAATISSPNFTLAENDPSPAQGATTQETHQRKESAIQSAKNDEDNFQHTGTRPPSNGAQKQSKNEALTKTGAQDENNLLHGLVTEHNIGKKQLESKEHFSMESENLIHDTPLPSKKKIKKLNYKNKKKSSKHFVESNRIDDEETPRKSPKGERKHQEKKKKGDARRKKGQRATAKNTKAAKSKKYPKKYNAKKHSLKKTQRKANKNAKQEKNKTQKLTKREKKSKLHQPKNQE